MGCQTCQPSSHPQLLRPSGTSSFWEYKNASWPAGGLQLVGLARPHLRGTATLWDRDDRCWAMVSITRASLQQQLTAQPHRCQTATNCLTGSKMRVAQILW
jgi:hypothetical protein